MSARVELLRLEANDTTLGEFWRDTLRMAAEALEATPEAKFRAGWKARENYHDGLSQAQSDALLEQHVEDHFRG